MNFTEAMDKLKSGAKVSRLDWKDMYFMMVGDEIKAFQYQLSHYLFNEEIMISEGWNILGDTELYTFCEITDFLRQGCSVKLKDWTDKFIYLDRNTKILILSKLETFMFIPDFASFISTDWIEIN